MDAVSVACAADPRLGRLLTSLCGLDSEIALLDQDGDRGAARLPALKARRAMIQDEIATVTFLVTRAWETSPAA